MKSVDDLEYESDLLSEVRKIAQEATRIRVLLQTSAVVNVRYSGFFGPDEPITDPLDDADETLRRSK